MRAAPAFDMRLPAQSILRPSVIRAVLSYALAAACLYWVFRDVHPTELLHAFAGVNLWLIAPAIILDLLVYVIAGWEWQILLRPAARVSALRSVQTVLAGRFANDALPVHVGYVVRIFLVSRWTGARISSVAPSLLIERLFDGIWLALGIGMTALFVSLPPAIGHVAEFCAGITGVGVVAAAALLIRGPSRKRDRPLPRPASILAGKLRDAFMEMSKQVRSIGRSRLALAAFGLSFLKFAAQCLAFLLLLWAYGFHFPFLVQMAVFLIAYVGLSLPSTPAAVGVFQLFCVASLQLFHVAKSDAAAFALLAFLVLTFPLSAAGFFALAQSGLTLRQARREAAGWKSSAHS